MLLLLSSISFEGHDTASSSVFASLALILTFAKIFVAAQTEHLHLLDLSMKFISDIVDIKRLSLTVICRVILTESVHTVYSDTQAILLRHDANYDLLATFNRPLSASNYLEVL